MKKKHYKGRCEKRMLSKCEGICRTYDAVQSAAAEALQADECIREIRCNVPLDGLPEGEYTSDFLCIRTDGDMIVRECIQRKYLLKPLSIRLLDISREYWRRRGVTDWGLMIDAEK